MEIKQLNAELKWTHCGQKHAYGDTFRECEIHTPDVLEENDILLLVGNGHKLPKAEWQKNTDDISIYFGGWYTITKI